MEPVDAQPEGLSNAGILAVAFAGVVTFLDLYATQPLLPQLALDFHASAAAVGLTVSAPTAAVALLAPIFGAWGDRLSRTRTILLSMLALAASTLLAATATGLPSLVFWRFLQGAATPGVYVMALAYLSEEAGPASVGKAMAAFVTGNVIGGFAGRALTGAVAARYGWPKAFVVLGVLNLLGALVTWRNLAPSRHFVPHVGPREQLLQRFSALGTPRLLASFAIGFNVLFCLVATFTYVVFYLAAPPFGLGSGSLSAVFSVYLIGALVTPLAGRAIDRAGARRVLVVAVLAGAAGMLLTLVPSLPVVVLGLAITCSAAFASQSASISQLRLAAPPKLGSLASGAYVTFYYLGGSAAGVAPGLLWPWAHWAGCVALVVCTGLVTMALALRFWADAAPVSGSPPLRPLAQRAS